MKCKHHTPELQNDIATQLRLLDNTLSVQDSIDYANMLFVRNGNKYPSKDQLPTLLSTLPYNTSLGKLGDHLMVLSTLTDKKFTSSREKLFIDSVYTSLYNEYHTYKTEASFRGFDGELVVDFTTDFKEIVDGIATPKQEENIKKRIAEEVVPEISRMHKQFVGNVIDWVNHGQIAGLSNKEYLNEDVIKHTFGNMKVSPEYLSLLFSTLGLSNDSTAHTTESFMNLYTERLGINKDDFGEDFDTDNVLFIVHNTDTGGDTFNLEPGKGKVIFSMYAMTTTSLEQSGVGLQGRTLLHNFIPFNNYSRLSQDLKTGLSYKELDMPNNVGELERLKLSMFAIAIAQKMNNAVLKNVSVLKSENTNHNPQIKKRWVYLPDMVSKLRILSRVSSFMKLVSPRIQEVLLDSVNMNEESIKRDYLAEFYHLLENDYLYHTPFSERPDTVDTYITEGNLNIVDAMMRQEGSAKEMRYVLDKIMNIMNNKRHYTKEEKVLDPLYIAATKMSIQSRDSIKRSVEHVKTTMFNIMSSTLDNQQSPVIQQVVRNLHSVLLKTAKVYQLYKPEKLKMMEVLNKKYYERHGDYQKATELLLAKPWMRMEKLKKYSWAKDLSSNKFVKKYLHEIHYDINDAETKALVDKGELTVEEVNVGAYIVKTIKSNMIDVFKKKLQFDNPTWTDEVVQNKANIMYATNWTDGVLPIMLKKTQEYIGTGELMKAYNRLMMDMDWNIMEGDMAILGETMKDDKSAMSIFFNQYAQQGNRSFGSNQRISKLGLMMPDDNSVLLRELQEQEPQDFMYHKDKIIPVLIPNYNERSNSMVDNTDSFSTEIETILDHFVMDCLFKKYMDTEGIPFYNLVLDQTDIDLASKNSEQAVVIRQGIEKIGQRLIEHKQPDPGIGQAAKYINAMYKFTSAGGVALNAGVAVTSFTVNNVENAIQAWARKWSGNPKQLFLPADDMKAVWFNATHMDFVEKFMDHYGIINRDPDSEMTDVRKKSTNKSVVTMNTAHIGNFSTDYESRARAVIAQSIFYGNLDAHNVVDGKMTYNRKKDNRFWSMDKNMNYTQSENQKLLWEAHVAELKQDDPNNEMESFDKDGNPTRAYTLRELQMLIKLGNEIVAAFANESKPLALSLMEWRIASQFKTFIYTKIRQRFGKVKKSDVYTFRAVVINPTTGKKEVIEQQLTEGGTFSQSVKYLARNAKQVLKTRSIKDAMNATPEEKYALISAGIDMIVWGSIGTLLGVLKGEDKDKKSVGNLALVKSVLKGFNSYTLLDPTSFLQMFGELPVVGTAKRMYKAITFQSTLGETRRLMPGGGTQKMVAEIYDYMNEDNE